MKKEGNIIALVLPIADFVYFIYLCLLLFNHYRSYN